MRLFPSALLLESVSGWVLIFGVAVGFGSSPAGALTIAPVGAGEATPNAQPSLGLKYLVRVSGAYEDLGEVGLFARTDRSSSGDPPGWMRAEGQLLPIVGNEALFSLLGVRFGGDGENDFALPDLRGRTAIGAGVGPDSTLFEIGQQVGDESFVADPAHTHGIGAGLTTGANAGSGAHSNYQPSLALTPIISATGVYPSRSSFALMTAGGDGPAPISASGEPFFGEIAWIAHDQVPDGWLRADGQVLQISNHDALFSLLGTQYGGDGRVTFALPDLRGRAAVGMGAGPGLSDRRIGSEFGAASETLTDSHAPPHTHAILDGGEQVGQTDESGGGAPQSNLQPSLAINYLVATQGTYPPSSTLALATDAEQDEPRLAEIGSGFDPYLASVSMFAGNFAPWGYLQANGQTLPISSHTALFSLMWDEFGGDAQSVFKIPDLRGRTPVGIGAGMGLTERLLAEQFGVEQSVLGPGQIAPHTHAMPPLLGDYNGDGVVDAADYTVWRDSPDSSQAGYALWAANYGTTILTAAASPAVPEPAAAGSLLIACLGAMLRRHYPSQK